MSWKVGDVKPMTDGSHTFSGSGFNIVDENGKPLVTFFYLNGLDAIDARKLIALALRKTDSVTVRGR